MDLIDNKQFPQLMQKQYQISFIKRFPKFFTLLHYKLSQQDLVFKIISNLKDIFLGIMTLTQQRAESRSAVIKQGSVFYNFHISLEVGSHYNGLTEITFALTKVPTELQIDFKGTDIKKLLINDYPVNEPKSQDGFVGLDVGKLKEGDNKVIIIYRNKYDNDGSGCVSFVDVDTKQYIYTQFEPYYANRVFPLFDQPDLKAKMRLNVISPIQWEKILSNEYPVAEKAFDAILYSSHCASTHQQSLTEFLELCKFTNPSDFRFTLFPQTKLLPTYLYCFIAGDYQQLKNENLYNGIPMSLYCIESLYKYMKEMAPFVFEITIESMKFFEKFFGYKYAFNKYDQVFAHEYKWGAMENAGIVTHNDRYIWKDVVSTETKLEFANTISHELAHHWFGNLVTMKWWDDLWLNESFADYISYLCLEKIKDNCKTIKYESAMTSFFTRKGWGYHEDQMITTHPIRGTVANTHVADSIFDGITYSKGASTMKQLTFLMSEDKFSKALTEYFHKFQWKNATLDDFIGVMENHFDSKDFTLTKWRELWLQKPCCNKIHAVWDPSDHGENAKLQIKQSHVLEQHPTLRMHRIKIGLVQQNGQIDAIQALIKPQQSTTIEYNASKGYKAVILNYEDHSFVKNVIDKHSLQYFSNNLSQISDLLSRTLVWKSFYDMIKDAQLKTPEYLELILKFIMKEKEDGVFETQFDYLNTSVNTYTPLKMRDELNNKVFDFILGILAGDCKGLDENRVVVLKEKLVAFAKTDKATKVLLSWLKNQNQQLQAHQMMLNLKWSAVIKSFRLKDLSTQEKWALFDQQEKLDPTDTAKNNRHLCTALLAGPQQFEKIYNQLKDPKTQLSITVKEYLASGLNDRVHSQLLLTYRDRYFADIVQCSKVLEGDHLTVFYEGLEPIDDDLEYQIKKFEEIKLEEGKFDKHIVDLKKIVDQLKRRQKAYKLYAQ